MDYVKKKKEPLYHKEQEYDKEEEYNRHTVQQRARATEEDGRLRNKKQANQRRRCIIARRRKGN